MSKRASITQVRIASPAGYATLSRRPPLASVVQIVAEAVKESKEVTAARELMRLNE
jgi:hypothetical protein